MNWKGKELRTTRDLMNQGVDKCETREEAEEFMRLYRADCKYADENIGYLSGYYGYTDMARIQDWFGVEHPFFSKETPTPEEAFAAGERMAREWVKD
jgi:hypothetical protein